MISDVPESFDLRDQWPECKREVRERDSCSPVVHSAVEVLGWRFCIATEGKTNLILSAQDAISCDLSGFGCQGGFPFTVWEYFQTSGVVTESCYPYEGYDAPCRTECVNGEEWIKYKSTAYKEFTSQVKLKIIFSKVVQFKLVSLFIVILCNMKVVSINIPAVDYLVDILFLL